MKVFVATKEGQGVRETDFFHSEENELVFFPPECGSDAGNIDGRCGCRRSMEGSDSGSTTTFNVVDLDISENEYYQRFSEFVMNKRGFDKTDLEDDSDFFQSEFKTLLDAANTFPVNLTLEKRGNDIQPRPSISFTIWNEE